MKRDAERGTVAIMVAILLPCLVMIAVLAIDFGWASIIKARLRNSIDGAALSGAGTLDGSTVGVARSKTRAKAIAEVNVLQNSGPIRLNSDDVEVGYWDRSVNQFFGEGSVVAIGRANVVLSAATAPQYLNASRVKMRADGVGNHNHGVKMVFSIIPGLTELRPGHTAVAVGGGTCEAAGCVLPLAVPSCSLVDGGGQTACGTVQTLYFNRGTGRDIVLANVLDPGGNVNNSTTRRQMEEGAQCSNTTAEAGDNVRLGNGNDFNAQIEESMQTPFDVRCTAAAPYEGCKRYSLAVSNNGDCRAPMVGTTAIVGFVQVVILETSSSGVDASIKFFIECGNKPDPKARTGCANFGFSANRAGLAQ